MKKSLSKTALNVLMALQAGDYIASLASHAADAENAAAVIGRDGVARFTVPPATFCKMKREGLIMETSQGKTGLYIRREYRLTEAGRAALDAA